MAKITIEVPGDIDRADVADYLRHVADQIEDDYTSGHYSAYRHWDSEGLQD